ncbi:MAG TPA: LacI family DNA-binding transcriptional regulator [Alphaproteobacteria bacterium]|nr:LacI family DNA-binding transcriptional regulator [Alphaproteobacteria bacterium]
MARTRTTLRDVARKVGVHPSTVSRVLNPATRPMVTEAIARRVAAAAESLGYHPNPIAYGLKTNRTLTAGVLIPDLNNPVFPPAIRGIEDVFGAVGYTAILTNTDNDAERARIAVQKMIARRVDGLILATARRRDPVVDYCLAEDIPLVLINRAPDSSKAPAVVADDVLGVRQTVAHLVALGHRRIAHIAGPPSLSTGHGRRQAFVEAMRDHGLKAEPRLVVACQAFNEEEGRRAFRELWSRDRTFTAALTANDLFAIGCYDAAAELGLSVPGDVSVTGFNDIRFVDKLKPPLTTVRMPLYEMGTQAAKALLLRIQHGDGAALSVTLATELIVRGSTAEARPAKPARGRAS